ncbi:MAG: helix-turn-helix transcriptional regulator [Deltaproteobacteria bacterium]|nr:helix-turn-helix transcriptional regulator [Deltaproteobacteria bacterium]
MARRAGVSYKALQLIEAGADTRLSTLAKIAGALGYSAKNFREHMAGFFESPPEAVTLFTRKLTPKEDWRTPFFNFVDSFRRSGDPTLVAQPPHSRLPVRLKALIASTVETLCDERGMGYPFWCAGIQPLAQPWFPSGIENLKATALVESPVHFRKRNIFVLKNFLERV